MVLTPEYLNPRKIELYSVLNSILLDHLIDINDERANDSNLKVKQWWFPEAPEKLDDSFPRGVIDLGTAVFTVVGADNFISTEISDGRTQADYYGRHITIPVTLTIFIKKQQFHYVTFLGDSIKHLIKNKKQADYFAELIPQIIIFNEKALNDKGFSIDGDITSGAVYEDGDFMWAIEITFDIQTQTLWQESYSPGNIIASYTTETEIQTEQ